MTAVTYFDVWRLSAFARTFGGRGPPTERRTVDRGRVHWTLGPDQETDIPSSGSRVGWEGVLLMWIGHG